MEDERLKIAIEALLENFLIQMKENPEVFRDISVNEKTIRRYMQNNFGYQLKLDLETAKLEKIPYYAREWMGVKDFKNELDYVFLMSVFATLETKLSDDGFLLSAFIDEVKIFLKDTYPIDWKIRFQRESFIRAMNYVESMDFVRVLDGDISDFENTETGEVLYCATSMIRYMFRNLSKSVSFFSTPEDLLMDDLNKENLRHSIFRKLYFEPILLVDEISEEERLFLSDKENYQDIKNNIELFTNFTLEHGYRCFYLINHERKRNLVQHPGYKNESHVIAHFSNEVFLKIKNTKEKPFGELILKNNELEELIKETRTKYSFGWSKKIREMPFSKLKEMIISYLVEWKLATYDPLSMQMSIFPHLIRVTGEYEREFREYITENIKEEKADAYF